MQQLSLKALSPPAGGGDVRRLTDRGVNKTTKRHLIIIK